LTGRDTVSDAFPVSCFFLGAGTSTRSTSCFAVGARACAVSLLQLNAPPNVSSGSLADSCNAALSPRKRSKAQSRGRTSAHGAHGQVSGGTTILQFCHYR
jgi:hypothetical protein